jgi:hypothetical protein
MTTYYRSLVNDFPNGLINSQLMSAISAIISTPVLESMTVIGDVVSITFDGVLTDETPLNTIISTYTPITYDYATPYIINNVLTNTVGNTVLKYFGNERSEIVISKDSQSHYNSISAALADNNSENQIFVVYPGTYIENNPIMFPAGTTIKSLGSASNTIIVAQDYTKDLIHLNQKCKISCFTLAGAYASGSRGIYFNGSLSGGSGQITIVSECMIADCDIGLEVDGGDSIMADTLFAEKIIVSATTHTLSKGIYCHSAGQFVTSISYVVGVPGYFPVLNAYDCQGEGSKISLSTSSVWFCNKGLFVDNNGNAEISLLNAQYNNIAVQIGPNGSTSRLSTSSLVIKNSTSYDIDIQAVNANIEIYSSFLDDSKLNNPNDINIIVKYCSKLYGQAWTTNLGDFSVGSPMIPSKIGMGEGLYLNSGIVILTNDNLSSGTWIDNTYNALISDPGMLGFNLFQSVNTNNCLYIGSDKDIFGLKINVLTVTSSITVLSDIIWEFWNGTNWIEFYVMQTYPDYPCHTYEDAFISLLSKFNIRFGLTSTAPFASLTLNGFNKKWLRIRIVNPLSSIPVGGYIKIHTNATRVNSDGFTELFGNARTNTILAIQHYPANTASGNHAFYLNENLSLLKYNNIFAYNSFYSIGFNFKMPISIDTSFPIKLNISFIGDNNASGDVYWTLRYTYSTENTPIYLTLLDSQNNPNANILTINKKTSLTTNQNNKDRREIINIDVHTIPANPSSNMNYIFYGCLERNGGQGLDSYPGNIIMTHIDANYINWAYGGHLLGF